MSFFIDIGNTPTKKTREKKGKSFIGFPSNYCIIDLETTGLSPEWDSIIEICAIKYENGKEISRFQTLVQPPMDEDGLYVDNFIENLTGITNEMLSSAPIAPDVLPKLYEFIGNLPLVGYNVNFDINFLYDNFLEFLGCAMSNDFIDIMRMAKKLHPNLPHHRLKDMVSLYQLTNENEHRAESDCIATSLCYEKFKLEAIKRFGGEESFINEFRRASSNNLRAKEIIADTSKENQSSPLYRKYCVFTGKLDKFTRKEAMQVVADLGGFNEDKVTKKTNFLVLGNTDYCRTIKDGKSAKQKKAETFKLDGQDIEILSESTFLDMLESISPEDSDEYEVTNQDPSKEISLYNQILPLMIETADRLQIQSDLFCIKKRTGYSSVYWSKYLLFRLKVRGGKDFVSLPASVASVIPKTANPYKVKSDDMLRIPVENDSLSPDFLNSLPAIIDTTIQKIPKAFDCCSRFEACSDARSCVHPDQAYSMQCGYRKILKSGRVFFGKNRNIPPDWDTIQKNKVQKK